MGDSPSSVSSVEEAPSKLDIHNFTEAAASGNKEFVEQFLNQWPQSLNVRDEKTLTALMQAAKNGQEEIVIMLLQRGGNVHEKDRFDRTARWFAHRNGHLGIAALIKEAIQNKVAMDAAKPLDAEKRA